MSASAIAIFPTPVLVTKRIEPLGTTLVLLPVTADALMNRRPIIAFPSTTSAPVIQGIEPDHNSGFFVSGVPPLMKLQVISSRRTGFHVIGLPRSSTLLLGSKFPIISLFVRDSVL